MAPSRGFKQLKWLETQMVLNTLRQRRRKLLAM